ncbi:hypothetical protein LVY72_20480 [Arthrobacter sp. I2-34]|uniref:Uncharacterized protein n=1 Tax=Arthrobacter hankyongi TaxID=2904801 RepID=A0ABS9LC83_9MICC|nr:hypothetical protein [Arthrobacter hankyongi]MCG2624270.1 hypothetical protein [Arthrobacter hankyongi]
MRADQWRLVLLQAFNTLLLAVAAGVAAVGADRTAAHYGAARSGVPAPRTGGWLEPGLFGALMALAGGLAVLVLGIMAVRRMARGERYAPLFTTLGWALLWLPLTMALTLLVPASPFTPFMATGICGAGIALSLAVLGSTKPR